MARMKLSVDDQVIVMAAQAPLAEVEKLYKRLAAVVAQRRREQLPKQAVRRLPRVDSGGTNGPTG